ncbi:chemotaxis protein CheW [Geomonas anaerohicana]|uniref:Chemotaxis protein CheW n=1 Tax=Geomonas anaerohicana TaxID=2798583 RepID=A0ABS0YFM9_9BACT|nr:chemotaxis protein CheW [Geomonas anaerohicana]MBJ6750944.1 chemotaxis protein CheW [Geomonas anaerohicana]
MNLAEIRKKASRGEAQGATAREAAPQQGGQEPRAESSPAPVEPQAPPEVTVAAEEFSVPEPFVDEPFVLEPVDPDPLPRASAPAWQAEQFDPPYLYQDEPDEFDPVAVILRGRESASFEAETSQQEVVDAASVELLCFRVASEEYAISIMDIKEIIKPREVTEVPRVPSFVRGILSLRGNIIPVFDMKNRLGLADGAVSERERIVVVKRQGGYAGVLVDEVVQVVRIAEGGIEPPPVVLEGIDREFVLGIGRVGGRMLILLDMEKVLDVGLL